MFSAMIKPFDYGASIRIALHKQSSFDAIVDIALELCSSDIKF